MTVTKVTQILAKDSETKDTLLVVHTLLLTFALATLQYSDQFVPVSGGGVLLRFRVMFEFWEGLGGRRLGPVKTKNV